MFATTDVLIAGAGPVGLMLAAELRRDGVNVRVIDAHDERVFFVKALGVTARTLELFVDLGIAREAIDAGVWLTGADTFQDGAPAFSAEIARRGLPYGALSLAQFETERILEAALARNGGHVEYGATLADFIESGDYIDARIQDACGKDRTIRCRWLVGCDGARSTVRRHLNIAFEGDQYPQTFMLADVDVEWNLPRGRMYRFNVSGEGGSGPTTLAALPVRGSARRYRLSMVLLPDDATRHTLNSTPDFDEISRIMLPILPKGTRLSSMRWSSVYRVSHRIAQHYSRARVFLAGDAAHIHPPVGGQGMNTGLQDAHNLAWKLTLASRGLARETLLDSYESERRPVGLDVVESTSRALNTVLAHGEIKPAMRETQLLVGYRGSSPIVADECIDMAAEWPAPGDRAPQAGGLVEAFIGHAQRLHDHLGRGRHTLVAYIDGDADGARLAAFASAVDAWRDALGTAASAVLIVSAHYASAASFEAAPEAYRCLSDEAGAFASAYGARNGMAWAVRPDGHIGFRSAACASQTLLAWLERVLGQR
ncbi:monooxygenase FAD-binding protein [Caballeronia fortuita]|uniref:Monooxygenase FAD-binding protein n=1 Tax=Caballeronia fortuita TaxID=1777138 RepID=A0A158AKZ8_9BURK|nr:FAD-dependent monooxygenase [Caballeronia fortuita]SAK58482.1 monooxygenase FAD-binding protein [Caballeronia fortuita]